MKPESKQVLVLAAPSSGSGKTVVQLALLRAMRDAGIAVSPAKAGPDFIDPGFHALAAGEASVNLDPWAMSAVRISALANSCQSERLLIEAMMGLFDGAADGSGSAADLAAHLNARVILVVDAAKQSHSIAALVRGFRDHRSNVDVAGCILNKVGSPRHEAMLREALDAVAMPVLGAIPRTPELELPERHLGLVLAGELEAPEAFIEGAAAVIRLTCDLEKIAALFSPIAAGCGSSPDRLSPPGHRVAIARDAAFAFCYPHLTEDWREQGAEISFFSPLDDQAPDAGSDAIYLPGGYPELHAGRLAGNRAFMNGVRIVAQNGALIYGECGGYMVLGNGLIDAEGNAHKMLGLLDLETSFAKRKLHLGYRRLASKGFFLGEQLSAHEFHYTTALSERGEPLFQAEDALGELIGPAGLRDGRVMGSYMHVIDGLHQ